MFKLSLQNYEKKLIFTQDYETNLNLKNYYVSY